MLANNVSYALSFDFAGVLVFGRRLVFLAPVECCMADFVQHGFDRLLLAHARADENFLRDMIEAALGRAGRRGI